MVINVTYESEFYLFGFVVEPIILVNKIWSK